MAKNSLTGGKVFVSLLLLLVLFGGVFLVYHYFVKVGQAPGYDELRAQIDALERENDDLRGENDDLVESAEGIPTTWFVMGLVLAALLLFLFLSAHGNLGGRNINRAQALVIATRTVADDHGWHFYLDRPGQVPVWVDRQLQTGQAIEGDIDGLWYVVQFASDWPEGGREPPGHSCVTVGIKSNDADRQVTVRKGLNASEFCSEYGIKLQRSSQPTDLARELHSHAEFADTLAALAGDRE